MSKIYTGGTFDLYHDGHVHFLWQCKQIAGDDGQVIVSLNSDYFIERYKGKPPIQTYAQRKTILESIRYVDQVVENTGGADSKPAIQRIKPDFIVIGSDWAQRDYYKQMGFTQAWLDLMEIVLIYVPYTEGISTTELKQRILA